MSANFYNNRGLMSGIDLHTFFVPGPGMLAISGVPITWGYVVGAPLFWPAAHFWNRTASVTADSWKMIQGGFKLYLIPHIPIPGPPPAPTQLANNGGIILGSNSTAVMSVHSVTGEKKPLATCVAGAFGLNVNCGKQIVGFVSNPCSVQTSPSIGDYVSAVVGVVLGKALPGIPIPILGGLLKGWIIGKIRKFVQEQVDAI